jgi:crotonobetainyl-CoA:carnitine CoA-transferase CaiB-like acyl-CoA transferase
MADISGGIYSCMGVLAALYARDNRATGSSVGQFVDVALVDAQISWLANIGASYFATGKRPARLGNAHPSVTPYQPVQASAPRGSGTRIRTSRRISPSALATRS